MNTVSSKLADATFAASQGLLTVTESERLRDGKVTRADLQTAQAAKAAAQQLARMTRPVSRDREVQFDRVSIVGGYPGAFKVVVKGQEVTAGFQNELQTSSFKGSRAGVHMWAVRDAAIATGLIKAIKAQLVMQTGVETALEEVKDGAATMKARAKDGIELAKYRAGEAAGEALEQAAAKAAPVIEAAKAKVAPVVATVTPVIEQAVGAAAPVVEQVKSAVAPVIEQAVSVAAPVVEQVRNAAAPVVERASDAVATAKNVAEDVVAKAKRLIGR